MTDVRVTRLGRNANRPFAGVSSSTIQFSTNDWRPIYAWTFRICRCPKSTLPVAASNLGELPISPQHATIRLLFSKENRIPSSGLLIR